MRGIIRPLVVFGVTSGLTLAAFQLTMGGAHGSGGKTTGPGVAFSVGYDLTQLELLEPTLYHIEESYVEPSRVDYERMYVAALEAVERRVPAAMFNRDLEKQTLAIEAGEFRQVKSVAPIESRKQLQRELQSVASELREHLDPDEIPVDEPVPDPFAEIEYALVNGVLDTLDPHSMLLPPEQGREMDVDNQGEFGGLGITIVDREGKLTVEYPLKDTPAERAGLQSDDHIVRIDGESTINMSLDEAVSRLRGKIGAPVDIEVMRDGLTKPMKITIVRERIRINPVEGDLLDGGIGYVSIKGFHDRVHQDLVTLLARLNRETGGLNGLILDLRGNPGGYLTQAEKVSDAFLWEGEIVSTVDGNGRKQEQTRATGSRTEARYPIVVLVSASSASASEIVAGALRNNGRAVIVGERTFGKGSVQNLHRFFDDSMLKLTVQHYWTPGDKSIQSVGVPADIELQPALVRNEVGEDGEADQIARLFWRERVRREADLDHHLVQNVQDEQAAYVVRYLLPKQERRRSAELNLAGDYEVQFAKDVLLAAPSYRRAEILAASAGVVERHQRDQERDLVDAFATLGIDWSDGPGAKAPSLDVSIDLGTDGHIRAGEAETVTVSVTNTGDETLYRLAAVARDNDVIEGREFVFGKLEPGQTGTYSQDVNVVAGYPDEVAPVSFSFRDRGGELVEKVVDVVVEGQDLPRLAWTWSLDDSKGDGDGVVDVSETLDIILEVENVGPGAARSPFARIKNRSGRALDIVHGTVEPGRMVDAAGELCEVLEPGVEAGSVVGNADADPARVEQGDSPVYAEGCERRLAPGASWTGRFQVKLKEAPQEADAFELELTLGDAEAYDHASVVRAGFYSYFTQQEDLSFVAGEALPTVAQRLPPVVEVTMQPAARAQEPTTSVSGVVKDDAGLAHVMVFAGDNKVFYQGKGRSSTVRSVPFTADVHLEAGLNTITVLATDNQGLTSTQSVVTYLQAPAQYAATKPSE